MAPNYRKDSGVSFPRINSGEERSVAYWWSLTQLTGFALYRIFIFVYSTFHDSNEGHKSIRNFMEDRGLSHLLRYFNPMSRDENQKLSSDLDNIFLDISFINKAFRNALTANGYNYHVISSIANEVRSFNDERNLLSHNRIPGGVTREILSKSLSSLKDRIGRLCNLASQLKSSKSHEMEQLFGDISKELKILLSQDRICSKCHRLIDERDSPRHRHDDNFTLPRLR